MPLSNAGTLSDMPMAIAISVCDRTKLLVSSYSDPKTGHPYATIEAFRKIREKEEKGK